MRTDPSTPFRRILASNLGQRLKGPVMRMVGSLGYKMVPLEMDGEVDLLRLLARHQVQTVIDVGANQGQFGSSLRMLGWNGPILSIEPLPEAFTLLNKVARRSPPWRTVNMAVGSLPGRTTMNVSRNSVSSSLFFPAPLHIEAAPLSAIVETIDVSVDLLDQIAQRSDISGSCFLKIDTQGYEFEVLKGAEQVLMATEVLQIEVSMRSMYEGQPEWLEVLKVVAEMGFYVIAMTPALVQPNTHELLQIDVLLVRPQRRSSSEPVNRDG